jgi:hypothetical protein
VNQNHTTHPEPQALACADARTLGRLGINEDKVSCGMGSVRGARDMVHACVAMLCGCALLPGCASTPNQAELKFLETRELGIPYSPAYDAALNAVFSMGLTITHTDKGSGVISAQSGDHAQRATMSAKQRKEHPVKKVTLMVRPRTDRTTQLRMKVLINEEQQLDRTLMTQIWQRIEREAMLDAPPNRNLATHRRQPTRRTRPRG